MKSKLGTKKLTFLAIFVLSFIVVFFVGRKFDSESLKRNWIFTTQGLQHFRKGLDISGGTKLVYKIDYTQYKDLYPNELDFLEAKQLIEDVIIKNIDGRISKLGVSDYKSYIQSMEDETQVVIEIWGIADLDQAKEIIGKTVELEFRLQNTSLPTAESIAERKLLAESIKKDIEKNPLNVIDRYESRQSDNIFARSLESVALAELPEIYQQNIETLLTLNPGEISPIIEGEYEMYGVDAEGNLLAQNLEGFLVFKVNEKELIEKDSFTVSDVNLIANQLVIEPSVEIVSETSIESGKYEINGRKATFNLWEIVAQDQLAFDVRIISLTKPTTLGKTPDEVQEINTVFTAEVNDIKDVLEQDFDTEVATGEELYDGYLSLTQIQELVSNFSADTQLGVYDYTTLGKSTIVLVRNIKAAGDQLFQLASLDGIQNIFAFENDLRNQTYLDLEEIFVQNKVDWKLAQGKDGSVLNGAYFESALPTSTQFGQPAVSLKLNSKGKEIFCEVTKTHVNESMGIFIWGIPVTIANINEAICDGEAQISGGFGKEEAKLTAEELNSGKMPAPLILSQEEKVSPTLGSNAFKGALIATLVGVVAILLYLLFIYGFRKATVTAITIALFMLVLMAIVKLFDYALSLSGIAAIILAIGMAVDANILIFERMNEEVKEGKSITTAINEAKTRSRSAIRDGQISTLLIWLLLYFYGMNMFKGFGTMIVITAILTLLVNVPVIQELLHLMYKDQK